MKKSFVLAAMLFIAMGSFAYSPSPAIDAMISQEKTQKMKDCVMMKDGKMYVVKDGESTEMTKAVVMSNGSKVLANGDVIAKNGDTVKLEDGDVVYMNGKIEKKTPGSAS